jgi:hypothetical protein
MCCKPVVNAVLLCCVIIVVWPVGRLLHSRWTIVVLVFMYLYTILVVLSFGVS